MKCCIMLSLKLVLVDVHVWNIQVWIYRLVGFVFNRRIKIKGIRNSDLKRKAKAAQTPSPSAFQPSRPSSPAPPRAPSLSLCAVGPACHRYFPCLHAPPPTDPWTLPISPVLPNWPRARPARMPWTPRPRHTLRLLPPHPRPFLAGRTPTHYPPSSFVQSQSSHPHLAPRAR
jgi:hypothetical protein